MSCANPDEAAAKQVMPRREPVPKGMCSRCREARSLYIVRSVTFCKSCFEHNVGTRLARVLNPSLLPTGSQKKAFNLRPTPRDSGVVIALSGGAGSTALLELLADRDYFAKNEAAEFDYRKGGRPPVWKKGYAVHVDFSGVAAVASQTDRLRAFAEDRGLTFVAIKAEDAFDPAFLSRIAHSADKEPVWSLSVNLAEPQLPLVSTPCSTSTATPLEQLQALLSALPPPSRPAFLENILDALLASAAETLPNVSDLLVGETSTREAQRVISGTASGRGWALPLELARSRALPNHVVRIKAMKEVSLKEAAIWCHGRGLSTFNERRWDSTAGGARRDARGKGTIASIEALTERFVASLSVTHPSTVTTINKTGDKLRFTGDLNGLICPVCEMPVDPSATEWKANAALTSLPGRGLPADEPAQTSEKTKLAPLLCYACLTTFTPLSAAQRDRPTDQAVALPVWIGERVPQPSMTQTEMKAQVAEFLLE